MFMVKIENIGEDFYLRGTVWTPIVLRADTFKDTVKAQEAIDKAAKFLTKAMVKAITIIEAK